MERSSNPVQNTFEESKIFALIVQDSAFFEGSRQRKSAR